MEQPDPLWQLLRAKGQEQGEYAEKNTITFQNLKAEEG